MMKVEADQYGFSFPYLHDETQAGRESLSSAACTPDFFLYDNEP